MSLTLLTAYHITLTTNDSRTSERMIRYKVRLRRHSGTRPSPDPIRLCPEEELLMARIIGKIARDYDLKLLAWNICLDHVHLLILCKPSELNTLIGKLKGRSSYLFHRVSLQGAGERFFFVNGLSNGLSNGLKPIGREASEAKPVEKEINSPEIPPQKHFRPLWSQKFHRKKISSYDQLWSTINYIRHNRKKHDLPPVVDPDNGEKMEDIIRVHCYPVKEMLKKIRLNE